MSPSRRRVSGRVTGVVLVAALAVAAAVVITSPLFHIREVEVRGAGRLGEMEVIRLSGISLRDNLILADTGAAEDALLGSPWVAGASIERSLPGTLIISIRERRPVAEVPDGRGAFSVVAADGVVVARAERRNPALVELPPVPAGLAAGARLGGQGAALRVAASFDERLRRLVSKLRVEGAEIRGTLAGGGEVRYGRAESMPQKNAAILNLVRYARREGLAVEYLDVSTPTSPVLKPAGAPEVAAPPDPGP
ncbi:MAG TPA: FtsQ-type POTRA domain-containing protein [Actinomycetota bacterium]